MTDHVMFHIHSLGQGGAERVVINLATEMLSRGIRVSIATAETEEGEFALPEGAVRYDIGTRPEEENLAPSKKRKLRKKRLHELLKKEKPDVLFSLCRGANYRAVLASKGTGVPVIISVRSDPKVDYSSKVHKLLSSYLYSKAAGAVFQTSGARDFFPEKIRDKSRVILNPIGEAFTDCEQAPARRKAVVAVGRHNYAKDYMTLAKSFERVLKDHPDHVLEIYGHDSGDNSLHQLREWIRSHQLETKILIMGDTDNVAGCISDAACYVLSSSFEGMPNALMEAMALGLPVLATDCPAGGPKALIEDGFNGLLCEVGNFREMAAGINKYLEYPDKAAELGKAAMEIKERAGIKRITDEWLEYAESVRC
ncbi:MAG: glycosyltransferase [Lachnospiraceae bacterium]|nr:glycosyltransferase [Lachnospiraceae bacterium]